MTAVDKSRLRHGLLNESRVSIINHLLNGDKNISDLESTLSLNRSTICYHLNILEDVGILESMYVILDETGAKGRAARRYSINQSRLREALQAVDELKNELEV